MFIPVAGRSKAEICGRSLAGFAGLIPPPRDMDVCVLWVFVLSDSLRRADPSTRAVILSVVCLSMIVKAR
jgi:hypothetical protein